MPRQTIAVLGGGPKAAAIAAKAYCIRMHELADVHVDIFEKTAIGAHWRGGVGYTDGNQRLCTPVVRDLGFPYDEDAWPYAEICSTMHEKFSWSSYLQRQGGVRFADWVDRGSKSPTHKAFADYLKYVVDLTETDVFLGEVIRLLRSNGRWYLKQIDKKTGNEHRHGPYDALVITGPGVSTKSKKLKIPAPTPGLFDGVDFWKQTREVLKLLAKKKGPIVLIGAGGTSAAIAGWLAQSKYKNRPIRIIAEQATLFTRSHNYFENRIFSHATTWATLGPDERAAFTARLNRGVVWESVMDVLEEAAALELIPGRAESVEVNAPGEPEAFKVSYTANNNKYATHADIVINAAGFDRWWFTALLPTREKQKLGKDTVRKQLETDIDESLAVPIPDYPPLHLPMGSFEKGPGYGSLMALGRMADKILAPYVQKALT